MTKLSKSIEIEAPPEKVFALILDVEKMNEITKGFAEFEITSKGPFGVGTTMHYVGKAGGSQAEWDLEVTEFEKNKKISAHTVGKSKFKMETSYILEPTAKGTSDDYKLPYSILGKIVDKLRVSKDIEKSSEKQLSDMKKALEA